MAIDLSELNVIATGGEGAAPGAQGELMYYRKPQTFPDGETPLREAGWIVWGEANDKELVRMTRNKGFTPLYQYGQFDHNEKGITVTQQPYYRILHHPAGPSEFPLSQIVELGWHKKPPYGVSFPQLEGVNVAEVQCSTCRKTFSSLDPKEAEVNLHKHELVMHHDDAQNQNLARVLSQAQKDVQGPLADVLVELVKTQQQQGQVLATLLAEMNKKAKG